MQNNRAFIAELNRGLIKGLLKSFSLFAFADEGQEGASTAATSTAYTPTETDSVSKSASPADTSDGMAFDFEKAIAQARQEEKDKLYPRLTKAENRVKELTSANNKYILENASLKDQLSQLQSQEDSEEVTNLKQQVATLTKELETVKSNTPDEATLREKISQEYEIKAYAQEQIRANSDSILSMFHGDIKGSTREEIDAAITAAKEKTLSVKKDLGLVDENGNPVTSTTSDSTSTNRSTTTQGAVRAPVANPAESHGGETFDAEYIRSLAPDSPEYAAFRKKMGLK